MKAQVSMLVISAIILCACSGGDDDRAAGDHVWKEQTATLDKARAVEDVLKKSARDKANAADRQVDGETGQ